MRSVDTNQAEDCVQPYGECARGRETMRSVDTNPAVDCVQPYGEWAREGRQ